MAEAVHLTKAGKQALEEKLEYLKTVRRAEITEEIAVARSFGDLSENAEYDAAKEAQAHNELEIAEIQAQLENAVIIEEGAVSGNVVNMGSLVTLRFVDQKEEDEFQIVGEAEADYFAVPKRISNDSPIGASVIGHKVGETVTVQTPGGVTRIRILGIRKQ
ncbi:MAG: transcription elongation factor GreA [Clostridia bacterium]|nr:transcription elongation factor GreA [Clostridia bacterium]